MTTLWKNYPETTPIDCGKCLVEVWDQNSLGLSKYLWLTWWNGESFEDFAGCDEIRKGASVKRFIEDKQLWAL